MIHVGLSCVMPAATYSPIQRISVGRTLLGPPIDDVSPGLKGPAYFTARRSAARGAASPTLDVARVALSIVEGRRWSAWETAGPKPEARSQKGKARRDDSRRAFLVIDAGSDLLSHTVSHTEGADGRQGKLPRRFGRCPEKKKARDTTSRAFGDNAGSDLLSHTVSHTVASLIARRSAARVAAPPPMVGMGNCRVEWSLPGKEKGPRHNVSGLW